MSGYQNWSPEAENRERKNRKIAAVLIAVVACLFVVLILEAGVLAIEAFKNMANQKIAEEITDELEDALMADISVEFMDSYLEQQLAYAEEVSRMTGQLGTGYDGVWPVKKDSMSCIVKKDGKWGMVSVTGEVLVPVIQERFSFKDNTGWVEFERDGMYYVYDEQGDLVTIYPDKLNFRMSSEEDYLFRTASACMSGMKITTIIPEIQGDDYYGVEYYNRKSKELLYSAKGGFDEVGIYTLPDETGRAVALRGNGMTNTLYYITSQGCESRVIELPEGINGRWFDFLGDYTWADFSLSQGWLKVRVCDAVPGFLIDDYEYYYAFLNVDTLELISFPEEYSGYFSMYNKGYGDAMAICRAEEQEEPYKYAICKGNKKLTEEIYYWVEFDETFITAGHDNGVDVLNYEGVVLATYWDVSGEFVNGKMLVCDEKGVFFVNEQMEKCSGYIVEGEVDGCFYRGVLIDGLYYILEDFAQ